MFFFSSEGNANRVMLETKQQNSAIQNAAPRNSRTFEDLKQTYSGSEFNYESTEASSGWWTRFKQWISEVIASLFDLKNDGQASNITNYMINICAVIVVLLVIYFIFKAIINKEGQWVFGKSSDKNIIPVSSIELNLQATDFETLISSAEKEHNYRLAVRYYYLWLLKHLNERGIIVYDVEKTNSDYQYEITSETIQKEFAYTSYLYNYIWYGEFNVDEAQFSKAKKAFNNLLNSVKK